MDARFWGYSSVGRAPALQAGGQGFESPYLHGSSNATIRTLKTTYQEMIILVNRVRHPRVQGKTCTKRGKETERLTCKSEKEIHASISNT